jgi:hypothetical protein
LEKNMPATKPKRKGDPELTVTTGWGRGRKVKFIGFAEGERWLAITNVGPSTTIITGTPGHGDAIVELDGERLACWFRNLDPFPARVVVVHEEQGHLNLDRLDEVDTLAKIADLGGKFFRKDHKAVCSRLKRMVAKHGEFSWVHYGHRAPVLVVGVLPNK